MSYSRPREQRGGAEAVEQGEQEAEGHCVGTAFTYRLKCNAACH